MTMPIIGAAESSERRSPSEFLDHPRRVAVATLAMTGLAAWSTWSYMTYWHDDDRAERWFAALLPQIEAATTPIPLVDDVVPSFVTNGVRYPENLMSRVLAGEKVLAFTTVATDRLEMIDDEGRVVPVAIPVTRVGEPGPRKQCGWRAGPQSVTIPLDAPVAYGGWWVRIGYLSSADSAVRVTAGDLTRDTTVRAGVHALYFEGGPRFDEITISGLDDDTTLCTNDVTVGRAVPSTRLEQELREDLQEQRLDPELLEDQAESTSKGSR